MALLGGHGRRLPTIAVARRAAAPHTLLALFIAIEARVAHPLMPLRLFRSTTLNAANAIGVLWSAAMFAWFFLSALYLQRVLGYSAMKVGLAFLPSNIIMAVCSLGLSARIVMRFDLRWPLAGGLLCAAIGLALFARAPLEGNLLVDVMPGMLLLGLAVLASLAAARTGTAGDGAGLLAGYQLAFGIGAACAMLAAALGATLLPARAATPSDAGVDEVAKQAG